MLSAAHAARRQRVLRASRPAWRQGRLILLTARCDLTALFPRAAAVSAAASAARKTRRENIPECQRTTSWRPRRRGDATQS